MHLQTADGLALQQDLRGTDDVTSYFQAYWDNYEYAGHEAIVSAADPETSSAFSFSVDKVPTWLQS